MATPLTKAQRQLAKADTAQYPHLAKAVRLMEKLDRERRHQEALRKYRARKGQ